MDGGLESFVYRQSNIGRSRSLPEVLFRGERISIVIEKAKYHFLICACIDETLILLVVIVIVVVIVSIFIVATYCRTAIN